MMVDSGHAVQASRHGGNLLLAEVGHKIYMICPWAKSGNTTRGADVRVTKDTLDTFAGLLHGQGLHCESPASCSTEEDTLELLRRLDGVVLLSGWDLTPEGRNLHGSIQTSGKTVYYIDSSHIQDLEDIPMLLASNRIVFAWSKRKLNTFLLEKKIGHRLC
jgi:hypothetical protein